VIEPSQRQCGNRAARAGRQCSEAADK
jgi:hypothetical protein